MKRHLIKDANRPSRGSKKEVAKPLDTESLGLATGVEGQILSGAEEIKPSDNKRSWSAYSGNVAPEEASTQAAVGSEKSRKETGRKPAARPASRKSRRGPEQNPSQV